MIEITPIPYTLYKGSDFFIKQRFTDDNDVVIDLAGSTVFFTATYGKGGNTFLSIDSTGADVTIVDNIITCKIPRTTIPTGNLYYRIDVLDTNGVRSPWSQGTITVDGV
jgi:hypothetical protein